MKLIKFDATTASGFKTGESTIRFNSAGAVTLSKTFVSKAGLKDGDKVIVAQDEESPEDWYLIPDNENGFPLRKNGNGSDGLCFNNAYTAKSIIDFLGINTKSVAFKICTEPVKIEGEENSGGVLYSILTSTAKYVELEEA